MRNGLLGDHAEILSGFAFKSANFNTDGRGMPLVRIRDVVPGETSTFYDGSFEERFVVQAGDTLIGMDGDFNRALWKSAPALLNQRVCKITARCDLDQRYLYHLLPELLQVISDRTPFVTVKHLSAKDLRETEIPLPPLEEQKRIAAILDQADALRRLRRRALDRLNTLGQAIFHEMFGDVTGVSRVPIAEFADVKGGKRLPKGADYADQPTQHPYIRVSNIGALRIDASEIKYITSEIHAAVRRYTVQRGDVVISIAGTIGLTAAVPAELAGANLTENAAKIAPKNKSEFDADYLAWALSSSDAQSQISARTGQVTIGKLALFRVEQVEVPFPEIEHQRAFASRVAELEIRIASQAQALLKCERLFTSIQHRAFRGEL